MRRAIPPIVALGTTWLVAGACQFDWDRFDPRAGSDATGGSAAAGGDGGEPVGTGGGVSSGGSGPGTGGGGGGVATGGGTVNTCGDGALGGSEECDDGNDSAGDGCDDCAIELGHGCSGEPSVCAMLASEQQTAGPGLGLSIPDGGYDGSLASMACVSLAFGSASVHSLAVTLGIDHPYLGDLVIKIESPANTVTTIISRPGIAEPVDDLYRVNGDSSNLSAAFPIEMYDVALTDGEVMGSTIGASEVVCGDDGVCAYHPNPGAGPGALLSDFAGEAAAGAWQVCVGDGYGGDQGTVDAIGLVIYAL